MRVALTLNGAPVELECRTDEMLLDVLRREAGVTSVHETCRIGVCGACTVLVDGQPISACLLLTAQAAGRSITTVEGLGPEDPTVRAFAAEHAFQCGWCTPGFVLTADALLDENPHPGEREIALALGGNLCRCGSYAKIVSAVQRAAQERERTGAVRAHASAAGRRLRVTLHDAEATEANEAAPPPSAEPAVPAAAGVSPSRARSARPVTAVIEPGAATDGRPGGMAPSRVPERAARDRLPRALALAGAAALAVLAVAARRRRRGV